MPTKRKRVSRGRNGITQEALDAWRNAEWLELHRALGLKPWELSPLDVDDGPVPEHEKGRGPFWGNAVELRAELIRQTGVVRETVFEDDDEDDE